MKKLLTVQEVAEMLHCHPQSIYRNKELPYIKIPGVGIRYKESELNKYIEQKSIKTHSLIAPLNPAKSFNLTNLDEFDKIYLQKNKGGISGSMKGKKTRWNYGIGSVYIRKTKQGKVRWYADYQDNGKRVREVVKNAQSRAEAVLYLQEKVAEAFNNVHGTCREKKPIKFTELADCYIQDYAKLNKRTWKNDRCCINAHLKPFFGEMQLNEITPLFIEKYRAKRLKTGVTKSTVNRELAIMKKMFNLSIDWKLATENPVKKVKFFSEKDNLKERILTKEEEDRLLVASAEHLKPILIAALNTGMRLGEILSLKWGQIDFEKELVRVEKTKSGKIRYVNINSVLSKTLENLKAENGEGEFLFTNPETGQPLKDVKTAFKSACRRANIKNLRFHDLRHTFASRLVESGVDLITVKELLGHSTVKITERYTHPNQSLKKEAVELLAKKPGKSDDMAHIWHTERKKKSEKHVTDSISVN